jgi:hypothetical protein
MGLTLINRITEVERSVATEDQSGYKCWSKSYLLITEAIVLPISAGLATT